MHSRTLKTLAVTGALLGAACGGFIDGNGETGYKDIGTGGGEVRARDTVVTVPEGAVDSTVNFSITPVPADQLLGLPEGVAGKVVDVGPEGREFNAPVTVQLRFDRTALPDATRTDLAWIGAVVDGEWEPLLDPVVDEAESIVRGTTRRAGRFGILHACGRGRRCPTALEFESAPQRVQAGDCSAAVTLKAVDMSGRRSPLQHDTAVALSTDEINTRFFSDAACQREISSLTIPARQTDGTFYFRGRVARSVTLTAQARDLRQGNQDETIYPGLGVAFDFVTSTQRVHSHACSAEVTVAFVDAFGNRAPVPNDARVTLAATAPTGSVTFYSDDRCMVSTAGVTMTGGTAAVSFWFKDDLATLQGEAITLTATVGAFGGAFSASQAESVGAPAPSRLRFQTLAQSLSPGACSAPTMVGLEDASGNRTLAEASTAVDMAVPAGLMLYSDQFCNQAISNRLTIAPGAMSASFYFRAPNVGTYILTASSAGLGSDSQNEDVR
ncbi:MAG TPA: hypothetical protein VIG99_14550 [Myxococcaceae bacterium]|jgi:hypothetical protein